jgi:hypothetical protein
MRPAAIGGGSYHLKWSRGLQIPYDISCDNVPQMSLEVWVSVCVCARVCVWTPQSLLV